MTDMRNFTALGESYGEAGVEDFTQVMNNYMTALSVPILKNDGTLIKFIGDAQMDGNETLLRKYTPILYSLRQIT
jgi:class 3 adenylate cyclase